jgi:hypothetical protein
MTAHLCGLDCRAFLRKKRAVIDRAYSSVSFCLDRAGVFRHACDLDLLLFFIAHPSSILPSESLSSYLGYKSKQIGHSLQVLLAARLSKRTQTPAHAARIYLLDTDSGNAEWLPSFLDVASTRELRWMQGSNRPPVVALTGFTSRSDHQRTEEAGFDGHINKPFDSASLVTSIQSTLARRLTA